jgi:hypothetical protein
MTTSARSKRSVSRAKAPIAGRRRPYWRAADTVESRRSWQADRSACDRINKPPKSLADEVGFSVDALNIGTYSTLRRKLTIAR